jgi:hypothetical protein
MPAGTCRRPAASPVNCSGPVTASASWGEPQPAGQIEAAIDAAARAGLRTVVLVHSFYAFFDGPFRRTPITAVLAARGLGPARWPTVPGLGAGFGSNCFLRKLSLGRGRAAAVRAGAGLHRTDLPFPDDLLPGFLADFTLGQRADSLFSNAVGPRYVITVADEFIVRCTI